MTDPQWRSLQDSLRSLADETSDGSASPAVETILQTGLRERQERAVRPVWKWSMAASLAAIGFLGLLLVRSGRPEHSEIPTRAVESYSPWFVERAAPAPIRGQVVRMRVSGNTAAAFGVRGVRYDGTTVEADVFIGDDGIMRAIRFVR